MTSINNTLTSHLGRLEVNGGKNSPLSRSGAGASAGLDDSVTLTITGTQIASNAREMASTPAYDTAKVERIKALIAEGQYSIDPQTIADRFVALEMSINEIA